MLQVLGCKEVLGAGEARWIKNPGGESEILCGPVKIAKQHPKSGFVSCKFVRFRLLLNDGDYSNSFVLLSSKVHICISEVDGNLWEFTDRKANFGFGSQLWTYDAGCS